MTRRLEPLLWLSDARGVYIPRDFADSFATRDRNVQGVAADSWAVLEDGPDNELYWETWDVVLTNAQVVDNNGNAYNLHQDGDLWLIPHGMEWCDEEGFYVWPEESEEINEEEGSDA